MSPFKFLQKLFSDGKRESEKIPMVETCPECGVPSGKLHDLFCLKERCPFCDSQLATCGCIGTVLSLSATEQRAVDEYVDDSIPPLSEIMERWQEALIRKGRVPFISYQDDLFRAANRGDIGAVREFLQRGSQPDAGNEVGYNPIMSAARGEAVEVIKLLLSKGGQAGLADERGYTALHWSVAQPAGDTASQLACLCALLDAGADPNACGKEGGTPLMNAAWFGCQDAVRELIRRGADPRMVDSKGRSALDLARERGHKALVELLR